MKHHRLPSSALLLLLLWFCYTFTTSLKAFFLLFAIGFALKQIVLFTYYSLLPRRYISKEQYLPQVFSAAAAIRGNSNVRMLLRSKN